MSDWIDYYTIAGKSGCRNERHEEPGVTTTATNIQKDRIMMYICSELLKALGKPKFVKMTVNAEQKSVRLSKSNSSEMAFRSRLVGGKSLWKYLGFTPPKGNFYPAHEVEPGVWEINFIPEEERE